MLKHIPAFIQEEEIIPAKYRVIHDVIRVGLLDKTTIELSENGRELARIRLMDFLNENMCSVQEAWISLKNWITIQIANSDRRRNASRIQYEDDFVEVFEDEYWEAIHQNP